MGIGEANNAVMKSMEEKRQESLYSLQTPQTMTGYFSSGSSGKLKLTSFVSASQSGCEKEKNSIEKTERTNETEKQMNKLNFYTNEETNEDIITIEESQSEADSESSIGIVKSI